MRLDYRVDPPIDLVFSTDELDHYNSLFQFLFLVKRVQLLLHRVWSILMRTRSSSRQERSKFMAVYALRARMSFFVDNLQYYLHVDVLDSQFELLFKKIGESRDFESVVASHQHFLITIAKLCFLHTKAFLDGIHALLDLCMEFSRVICVKGIYIYLYILEI